MNLPLRYLMLSVMVVLFLASLSVQAQVLVEDSTVMIVGPRFLVALVVGVLLALAFQLLLTNLSLATGLSMIDTDPESHHRHSGNGELSTRVVRTFGIWTLVTSALSLFFASLLATTFAFVPTASVGAVLGLAIWAMFYLIVVRLEISVTSSLVGLLSNLATSSLTTALGIARRALAATGGVAAVGGVAAAGSTGPLSEIVRNELNHSDEATRQKQQVRRVIRRLREETHLTGGELRELFYEFLHDPKAGADDLMARLKAMDTEHVKQVLVEHEDISEADAEAILERFDRARQEIINSSHQTKVELERFLARAKDRLGHGVEQSRALTAQAAWWAFCSAAISGAAAVIGGIMYPWMNGN